MLLLLFLASSCSSSFFLFLRYPGSRESYKKLIN
ncbi:Protein CBG27173 [Caenorhabditis briggsae]|uniref:Protein CBG27173 n=1 Tax=Caenorhabditis briggsae TaxID=6238 RepID=B6IL82_CAEBR|nr:Protein CBG27173 [Caenorhabditis briggsae]CAS00635.1 Protein CBG27173 [Caenorhabditis briggsae]